MCGEWRMEEGMSVCREKESVSVCVCGRGEMSVYV